MSNIQWVWVVALAVGLSACAGGAPFKAPNGMLPYASAGSEAVAPLTSAPPVVATSRVRTAYLAHDACAPLQTTLLP